MLTLYWHGGLHRSRGTRLVRSRKSQDSLSYEDKIRRQSQSFISFRQMLNMDSHLKLSYRAQRFSDWSHLSARNGTEVDVVNLPSIGLSGCIRTQPTP